MRGVSFYSQIYNRRQLILIQAVKGRQYRADISTNICLWYHITPIVLLQDRLRLGWSSFTHLGFILIEQETNFSTITSDKFNIVQHQQSCCISFSY